MRVAIVGAGPAGLYCAYLLRKWISSDIQVELIEQNPADATWGFGVVFSDRALEFLKKDDPETHDFIVPHMERWRHLTVNVQGKSIEIDGVGFTAIGRLKLLQLLQDRARSVGVDGIYKRQIRSVEELGDADLIIGADGVNSLLRSTYEKDFGAELHMHPNKFLWYGTSKAFDTLTQTFLSNEDGEFTAHHYRYAPDMSTFLIETNADTWARAGFVSLSPADTRTYMEELFAEQLSGHPIIENKSEWRNFPQLSVKKWSHENKVLVGDALHTAHFSIGSGTRLAMEDAIQLVRSLREFPGQIQAGLRHYEEQRRPIVETIVDAANTSLSWYTHFGSRMREDPYDFVYSYITRSGRIDEEKVRKLAPKFMAEYDSHRGSGRAENTG